MVWWTIAAYIIVQYKFINQTFTHAFVLTGLTNVFSACILLVLYPIMHKRWFLPITWGEWFMVMCVGVMTGTEYGILNQAL